MQTPDVILSPSERMILRGLVRGEEPSYQVDWVAMQRLRGFGYIEETGAGLRATAEGRRAIAAKQSS